VSPALGCHLKPSNLDGNPQSTAWCLAELSFRLGSLPKLNSRRALARLRLLFTNAWLNCPLHYENPSATRTCQGISIIWQTPQSRPRIEYFPAGIFQKQCQLGKSSGRQSFSSTPERCDPNRLRESAKRYTDQVVSAISELEREIQLVKDLCKGELSVALGEYPAELSRCPAIASSYRTAHSCTISNQIG
jgi:hypothetical protein